MNQITAKSVYKLKEHESTEVFNSANGDRMWIVTRVPGGWIYTYHFGGETFVPDNRKEHTTGPG